MLFGISNLSFHESIKIKIYIFLFLPFLYGSILWILKIKITLKYYKYVSSHCRGERINNIYTSAGVVIYATSISTEGITFQAVHETRWQPPE